MPFEVPQEVKRVEQKRLRANGYEPLEPFFILKEGQVWDERKNQPINFTKTVLEKIANVQNERITESGDFTPIIVGHTKKDIPEKDKQKASGWASSFEVCEFRKGDGSIALKADGTPLWAVRCTPWARPEKRSDFEDHRRRSVEMWTDPFLIDPISILGATTPRLDLGVHQLHRQSPYDPLQFDEYRPLDKLRYELEEDMADDNNGTTTAPSSASKPATGNNDILSQVFNSAEWQKMQSDMTRCMSVVSALEPMIADMTGGPQDQGNAMGGGAGGPPGGMGGGLPPAGAGGGIAPGEPTQMNAFGGGGGMAAPGGQNTMMPQQMHRNGQPVQFSYGQQTPVYDPREQEMIELKRQVVALHMERQSDAVNALLTQLETQIVIDRPRDYATLIQMEKTQRDQEVAYWLNTRKPVQGQLPGEAVPIQMQMTDGTVRQQGGPMTLQQAHAMVGTPADPMMLQQAPGVPSRGRPRSKHEIMMEAVRNRKNGQSVQEAYDLLMGQLNNGVQSVRG